ncbi:hypothetical protein JWS13_31335 [Rhodococcus pseudokoreensis]|uniref:Transposase n=1 Tax=Rhodococcus pseudokoreensis TaxID=2811421 RepID=A0A974W7P3_9NOCA|nr:hypothetical protein [Rhodococcus pseudokoreensis]QSE92774.1 hypothetical protein JWS13_31335 [Rhodococcus pseudokoreensis]
MLVRYRYPDDTTGRGQHPPDRKDYLAAAANRGMIRLSYEVIEWIPMIRPWAADGKSRTLSRL